MKLSDNNLDGAVKAISTIKKDFLESMNNENLNSKDINYLFDGLILEYLLYNSTGGYMNKEKMSRLVKGVKDYLLMPPFDGKFIDELVDEYNSFSFVPSQEIGKKENMDKIFSELLDYINENKFEQVVLLEPRKEGLSSLVFLSELVNQSESKNFVIRSPRHLLYRYSKNGKMGHSKKTLFVVDNFESGPEYAFSELIYQEIHPNNVDAVFVDWKNNSLQENFEKDMRKVEIEYAQSERYQLTKNIYNLQKARSRGVESFGTALFYYLHYDFLYQNIPENEYKKLNELVEEKKDIVYNKDEEQIPEEMSNKLRQFVETLRESFVLNYFNSSTVNGLFMGLSDFRGLFVTPYGNSPISIDIPHSVTSNPQNKLFLKNLENGLKDIGATPILMEKVGATNNIIPLGYTISKNLGKDIHLYNPRKTSSNLPKDGTVMVDVIMSPEEIEDINYIVGEKKPIFAIADMLPEEVNDGEYKSIWKVNAYKGFNM